MTEHVLEGIPFDIEQGQTGLWYAISPTLPGFFMAEPSQEILLEKAPRTWRWFQRVSQELRAEIEAEEPKA
jgi:hypothetical protein